MINNRYLICYDLETTGKNSKTCGIVQIAAIVIHPRTLAIVDKFNRDNIKWRPTDVVEDEAFKVTGKNKDYIDKNGIDPKQAWGDFVSFVQQYNPKKSEWNAPIPCGYNIDSYDSVLVERYCRDYGPWDKNKDKQILMSSFMSFDLMRQFFWWTESTSPETFGDIKLTTVSKYMGLSTEGAHEALADTENCAKIIIKKIRLFRQLFPKVKFKDAFLGNQD